MSRDEDGAGAPLPTGFWGSDRSGPILEKTLTVTLDPDLSGLSEGERRAVDKLLAAGAVFQRLYERQKHREAETARARLRELGRSSEARRNLHTLYRLFKGPVATTLDNRRSAFLPVAEEEPGKNVYPDSVTREELDSHSDTDPGLLHPRARVRRSTEANLSRDLQTLAQRPALDTLHPGLRSRLEGLRQNGGGLYGVPYSVAYAEELAPVYELLWEAAGLVAADDPDFSAFLRHRARDLLTDDYEGGDAAWVSGSFRNLDAQIGCYETYDDELLGVKTFMSLSLLIKDRERTTDLRAALRGIQTIEDRLPYDRPKRVRDDIPAGVYRVIADFGQARGANSATILPNEADLARKYGRVILMRHNILTHPRLFELSRTKLEAAVAPEAGHDLTLESNFQRILWHEIGHYLGVDRTADGRQLDAALGPYAALLEELKADLVSLFAAAVLAQSGHHSEATLRSIQASGILRVLLVVKPRREQPYQTMQLMQWNYLLEHGVLRFDEGSGRLHVDYRRYSAAVTDLLRDVLAAQSAGDPRRAELLVERWGAWRDDLHEVVARRLREALRYRYVLVEYAAIDGPGRP